MKNVIYKLVGFFSRNLSGKPDAYKTGLDLYRKKKWSAAEKVFRTAAHENPDFAPAYFKIGMCEFRRKRYDAAYGSMECALAKDPSQKQWESQLSQALQNIVKNSKKPNWQKEELLVRHLEKYPGGNLQLRELLLVFLRRQGKWWEEKKHLEFIISSDNQPSAVCFRLGEVNEIQNNNKTALKNFLTAIEIDEKNGKTSPAEWFYRAGYLTCLELDEPQNAEKATTAYYEKAISADSTLDSKRYGIGVFHQQRALWKEARDAYAEQLKISPADGELHYALGLAYDHCNQWEEASHHYQLGLAVSGGMSKWHFKLAYVFEKQEKWDSAVDAYRYAILMHPKPPAHWRHRLGTVLRHIGREQEAIEAHIATRSQPGIDLESAIIDPSLREYKNAISASAAHLMEEESRKHPEEPAGWYSLGKIYEKAESWEKAIDAYKNAIDRKSNKSAYWYYRLAYSFYSNGEVKKALAVFKTINEELLLSTVYKKEVNIILSDLRFSGEIYRFWFKVSFRSPLQAIDVHSLVIDQREVYTETASSFHFLPTIHYQSKSEIYYSFDVDLRDLDLAFLYHDYSISMTLYSEDGSRYEVKRKTNTVNENVKSKLRDYPLDFSFSQDQYIIYPYLTASQKSVSFIKRHYNQFDDKSYRELELDAIAEFENNKKSLIAQKNWLIFEKFSNTAQDNAYYFFLDIVKKRDNVYYVIDKDSPDRPNLVGYEDHIVDFMSKEHMLLLLSCEILISSETRGHVYAWRRVFGLFREAVFNKPYVFLQHGVTAMKKNDVNLAKTSHICAADRFVVTCEFEKNVILKDDFGYSASELIVAPFPRWHTLVDQSESYEEIFLMPTWRNWLEGLEDAEFRKTEYFREYTNLLTSSDLAEVLERHRVKLNFYLHPKIIEQLKHFDMVSDNINLIQFGQASVRDLLMRAKLLITDYSSVAWDFYYLKKPVLFFHFDLNRYLTFHGAHIDFDTELPGRREFDGSSVIRTIDLMLGSYGDEKLAAEKVGIDLFGVNLEVSGSDIIYQELEHFSKQVH